MVNRSDVIAGARPVAETSTRDRILRDISTLGPITTSALVDRLGLTETAVRRHIENLQGEGLIESMEPHGRRRRGRGRPAKSWVVSPEGHASLRADYDGLAQQAVRFIADEIGPAGVRALAEKRAADLVRQCASDIPSESAPIAERTAGLVRALQKEGYAATARPVGVPDGSGTVLGIQLCQGHCPVQHIAAEFPEFCDAETEAFSELLGVHVQRLATLAQGDHVCTTFVPSVGPSRSDAFIDNTDQSTTTERSQS